MASGGIVTVTKKNTGTVASGASGSARTSLAMTVPSTTVGNLLVLRFAWGGTTSSLSSVSSGATWAKSTNLNGTSVAVEEWWGICTSSVTTVTANFSSSTLAIAGCVSEFTGIATTNTVKQNVTNSGTTSPMTTTISNAYVGNLLYNSTANITTGNTLTVTTGWTAVDTAGGTTNIRLLGEYRLAAAAGSNNESGTLSTGSNWAAAATEYRAYYVQYAQAQTTMIKGRFPVNAQAQAKIKDTNITVYAQAQATITAAAPTTRQIVGQAQADIKHTYPSGSGVTYSSTITGDSPIAYWRLGDATGPTAVATVGPDGTYINTPTLGVTGLLTGDSDTAVTFLNTSTQKVDISSMPAGGSTGAAIEVWLNLNTTVDGKEYDPFSWNTQGTAANHTLDILRNSSTSVSIYWFFSDGANRNGRLNLDGTILTGTHHLVASHDYAGKLVTIYIDGSSVGTIDFSAYGTPLTLGSGLSARIGGYRGNDLADLNGTLDEVAIYSAPLSSTQVATHYTVGTTNNAITGPTFAQAQAKIGKFGLTGFGQTQAWIKAFNVQRFAQTQADIKNIGIKIYAQTQAQILTSSGTRQRFAQAQADIKQTYPRKPDYSSTIKGDSPAAYWRLGEPSGTNANDEIGIADGTYAGSPTLGVTGLLVGDTDTAVTFSRASTQKVNMFDLGSGSGMPAGGTGGATIEALFNLNSTSYVQDYAILSWGPKSADGNHTLFIERADPTNTAIYWTFSDGANHSVRYILSNSLLLDGTTYHIIL